MPHNGFGTSLPLGLSPSEMWTSDQSSMSQVMTFDHTNSATSSLESVGGLSPCDMRESRTTRLSGPVPVRVSRFRARETEKAMPTDAISGPLFMTSSPSATLQLSLESKLRAKMAGSGSPLFELTWKHWDMPAGLPICALRASARRTSDSGSIGWPTPTATDAIKGGSVSPRPGMMGLSETVPLAGWTTPAASDGARGGVITDRMTGSSLTQMAAGWATPKSSDATAGADRIRRDTGSPQSAVATQAIGVISNGSLAPTEKRGQLNPAFGLWLMGYPAEWGCCAVQEMRSSRK